MKEKQNRQLLIKNLIRNNRISNQEELSVMLEKKGIFVAQATLSRDMTEMHISKVRDKDGSCYRLPEIEYSENILNGTSILLSSLVSIEYSGNIAIIKTIPGHANMVASVIDGAAFPEVAGTIAGDDTVFLLPREGYTHEEVNSVMQKMFGDLDKIIKS